MSKYDFSKAQAFKHKKLCLITDFIAEILDMLENKPSSKKIDEVIQFIKEGVEFIFNTKLTIEKGEEDEDGFILYTFSSMNTKLMQVKAKCIEKKVYDDELEELSDIDFSDLPTDLKQDLKKMLVDMADKLD